MIVDATVSDGGRGAGSIELNAWVGIAAGVGVTTVIGGGAEAGKPVGANAATGGGAFGFGAGDVKAALWISELIGRSLNGRGGGIGAGRDNIAAGSIARRNAGTGGIGEEDGGSGAGIGASFMAPAWGSGAASGSFWRSSGAGAGTCPRV